MSVPSDLQRGREELLVVVALIRWAAMFENSCTPTAGGLFLLFIIVSNPVQSASYHDIWKTENTGL